MRVSVYQNKIYGVTAKIGPQLLEIRLIGVGDWTIAPTEYDYAGAPRGNLALCCIQFLNSHRSDLGYIRTNSNGRLACTHRNRDRGLRDRLRRESDASE